MRNHGILLPVASLPGNHGIGDFGPRAYSFIDFLQKKHFHYWQILPINPIGPGNSPYMTTCSEAIDIRYISLDLLVKDGLLSDVPSFHDHTNKIRYKRSQEFKIKYLKEAFENYKKEPGNGLKKFKTNNPWVFHYATFLVFERLNNNQVWNTWPIEQIEYFKNHNNPPKTYLDEIDFIIFTQYIAYKQWNHLLAYAHKCGVKVIGDMPFYVGIQSVDCWLNNKMFDLDENFNQNTVAGVSPDYFSADGQRWGNPIYLFDKMKEDNYSFLINRIKAQLNLFDYLRIDHFRAFDSYYVIPSSCPTAREGEWKDGPAYDFFEVLFKDVDSSSIIAEDLGLLRPSVYTLRDHYKLSGMNVIQFTFFDDGFKDDGNLILYTGTHDNETLWGWYKGLSLEQKKLLADKINAKEDVFNNFIKYIMNKPCRMCIISMADYIGLGNNARINTPGTCSDKNFAWKLRTLEDKR